MVKCCQPAKYSWRDLSEPVTFERKTRTPDGSGGWTETWAAITDAPSRCMVKPMSGRERWASQRIEATASHTVVTRYSDLITEADRAVIRGREYNIRFINNMDFDDTWLEIACEVGVAV